MVNLFYGRSTRKTYWLTMLAMFGISIILFSIPLVITVSSNMMGEEQSTFLDILGAVFYCLGIVTLVGTLILPSIRRLHDLDKSGWWSLTVLLPFIGMVAWVGLVTYCGFFPGKLIDNKYGPAPI